MPNSMADYSSYGDSWDDSVCVRESRGCKLYVYDEHEDSLNILKSARQYSTVCIYE